MIMGVSTSRILLLLLMLIPGNLNFYISRRHEDVKKNVKKIVPSCTDLLNMWEHMNRMTRHSLVTNEIPVFPRNFLGFLLGISETSNKHPSRTSLHLRKSPNRENSVQEEILNPFVKLSGGREPGVFLKIGLPDPPEQTFVHHREFVHMPKNGQEILFDQRQVPVLQSQIFQDIVSEEKETPEIKSTTYQRAFPLNELSDGLFGGFDDPFSEGFSSVANGRGEMFPKHHVQHQPETIGSNIKHHQPSMIGFRESVPDARLEHDIMDMFGTVLHDTEEEEKWNQEGKLPKFSEEPLSQWMLGGDMGSFGSFASDNDDEYSDDTETLQSAAELQKVVKPDIPEKVSQRISEFQFQQPYLSTPEKGIFIEASCVEKEDEKCNTDSQCACSGRVTLMCVMEKCSQENTFQDFGTWHSGPLSSSELGMNRERRLVRNPWATM